MEDSNTLNMDDIPKWDIVLEALLKDEYKKLNKPISLTDFYRLCDEHSIRFDDFMATMYQLAEHGVWKCQGKDQSGNSLSVDDMDGLLAFERVDKGAMEKYSVTWEPLE